MDWTIDVRGPNGVKHVTVTNDRVLDYMQVTGTKDPWVVATWLALTTLEKQ